MTETAAADAPPLDRAHFEMMTAGDLALQSEVAALFRGQVREWRDALSDPGADWAEALHKLKGSARGIGLAQLAEACEAAERAGPAHAAAFSADVLAALENALLALAAY
ncbi:MAG TPA: Hpt domain-containing protein [Caulobacterales bacterium]|nr:Hpt domain-containing protein [Caulobacterales bacterium]